jgi:hypothetical protein
MVFLPSWEAVISRKTIFIRTLLLITLGKLYRIALPLQVYKLDALHHRGRSIHDLNVQTGDYLGKIFHGRE